VSVRWLFLEPYHGGSHRQLVDGLCARFEAIEAWTLPARKWKWRMRGAAMHFARRFHTERPHVDGIWTSSLLNLAELRGLLPTDRRLRFHLYMHENQLAYPVQHFDKRDHHFGWTNLLSALAADAVFWNSRYNLDSFLDAAQRLLRKMPDARPTWSLDAIAAKSKVLPVPIDPPRPKATARTGPCHVVWNHRWEFDKGPQHLLQACEELVAEDAPFTLSLLGERFETQPNAFARLRDLLGTRLLHAGRLPREAYLTALTTADVALSTALHEFQGLSMLEAAACGAVPLVPDELAYREIWPATYRYPRGELVERLRDRIHHVERWRREDPRPTAAAFDWDALRPAWQRALEDPIPAG
jgi:glycosyltransferase involved in cell wall biosynthesis